MVLSPSYYNRQYLVEGWVLTIFTRKYRTSLGIKVHIGWGNKSYVVSLRLFVWIKLNRIIVKKSPLLVLGNISGDIKWNISML